MNVEIGPEAAQFLFWKNINWIFVAVYLPSISACPFFSCPSCLLRLFSLSIPSFYMWLIFSNISISPPPPRSFLSVTSFYLFTGSFLLVSRLLLSRLLSPLSIIFVSPSHTHSSFSSSSWVFSLSLSLSPPLSVISHFLYFPYFFSPDPPGPLFFFVKPLPSLCLPFSTPLSITSFFNICLPFTSSLFLSLILLSFTSVFPFCHLLLLFLSPLHLLTLPFSSSSFSYLRLPCISLCHLLYL